MKFPELKNSENGQAMVAYAFNPSTWEAEAGESLRVQGQPGLQELVPGQLELLQRDTLSQKRKEKEREKKNSKTYQSLMLSERF